MPEEVQLNPGWLRKDLRPKSAQTVLEFKECSVCSKPGMPILCASCLHNRSVIATLKEQLKQINRK